MATKLFVGSLPFETTDEDLKELFSEAGTVSSANVITDKYTGRSRGFGFVEMTNDEEAKAAIEKLNGYNMNGRNIIVNEARPMGERKPGGFREGGRGGSGGFRRGGFGRREE